MRRASSPDVVTSSQERKPPRTVMINGGSEVSRMSIWEVIAQRFEV